MIVENYNNIYQFINTIEGRQNNGYFGNESITGSFNFTGTNSYEEAQQQFKNGLPEITKELNKSLQQFKSNVCANIEKRKPINYYYGYAPNVPAAIMGLPKAMRYSKKEIQKIKAITIFYSSGANCSINKDTLLKTGKTVLQLVYYLEAKNIRVNLTLIPVCADSDERDFACLIKLKDYRQSLDLMKVSFPITSPSMFRRFGFKWMEGLEGFSSHVHGYGHSMSIEKAKTQLNSYLDKNSYFINYELCQSVGFDAVKLAKELNIVK